MLQNQFIHEINLDLDIQYLKNLIDHEEESSSPHKHHRLVKNDAYLSEIKNKYPFLSPVFNVYKFGPGKALPIHIDTERYCSINIPICNTEDSTTVFYNKDPDALLEYDQQRIVNYVKSPVNELFRFTLTRPTLINTTYPHSAVNNGCNTRIIISWSVLRPITFEECVSKYIR